MVFACPPGRVVAIVRGAGLPPPQEILEKHCEIGLFGGNGERKEKIHVRQLIFTFSKRHPLERSSMLAFFLIQSKGDHEPD